MSKLRRFLVISLVISIAGAGLPQPAQAAMLATERAIAATDAAAGAARERIDQLPAGADAGGALISALLIIFIVLLITDILGVTKVFPFTRPIK